MLGSTEPEQLGFAQSLFAEGDYYRSIGEYKRFLYLYPESPAADEARLAIARAYSRGGQTEAAVEHLRALASLSPEWQARAGLEIGWALRAGGEDMAAARQLRVFLRQDSPRSPDTLDRANYLLGWSLLHQGDGEGAARAFAAVTSPGQSTLRDAALGWKALPSKSPALAGVLSVVPGAGHVYIGEPVMGLAAFAWNGLFGFALYESIRREQVGVAVLLGVLESLWYSGTIFGAVSGAQKYNRDVRRQALERLTSEHEDHPEHWPPAR
ncbi:MAG: tetratricopeptide repeat protein [Cystobacter sp.]